MRYRSLPIALSLLAACALSALIWLYIQTLHSRIHAYSSNSSTSLGSEHDPAHELEALLDAAIRDLLFLERGFLQQRLAEHIHPTASSQTQRAAASQDIVLANINCIDQVEVAATNALSMLQAGHAPSRVAHLLRSMHQHLVTANLRIKRPGLEALQGELSTFVSIPQNDLATATKFALDRTPPQRASGSLADRWRERL